MILESEIAAHLKALHDKHGGACQDLVSAAEDVAAGAKNSGV